VTVTFSESVDCTTFKISLNGAGLNVEGTPSCDSVAKTGSFTPKNPLIFLTTYTITVASGLKDLASPPNAMATPYTSKFTTKDGTWGTASPAIIELGNSSKDSFAPHVASGAGGHSMAVWNQKEIDASYNIYSRRHDGSNWVVSTKKVSVLKPGETAASASGPSRPKVGVDKNGNAVVVWVQYNTKNYLVYSSRYDSGSDTWTPPAQLNTVVADSDYPEVAVASGGRAAVVWEQKSGTTIHVHGRIFNGSAWGLEREMNPGWSDTAFQQARTAITDSKAVAAFQVLWKTTSESNIVSYEENLGVFDSSTLFSTIVGSANPQVAIDNAGNSIVVWQNSAGGVSSIYARRNVGGTWDDPFKVSGTLAGNSSTPQIGMNRYGNAFAVWRQSFGGASDIYVSQFDSASKTWSPPSSSKLNTTAAEVPQVVLDDTGNAIAVWQECEVTLTPTADFLCVKARRLAAGPGKTWNAVSKLDLASFAGASNPRVAINGSGSVVAIWEQSDGTINHVYANRFQ
jgi:hypothetical protein